MEKNPCAKILNWARSYDLKSDGVTLTDASGKQYLEDLLVAVRHGLERRRTGSTASVTSVSSVTEIRENLQPERATAGPSSSAMIRSQSIDTATR